MNTDLQLIKKHYGEKMMHFCRSNFSTILETEGLLFSILDSRFEKSKVLFEDIIKNDKEHDFKNYINGLVSKENKLESISKSPQELLSEAGYTLYECNTEVDIQSFRKYYKYGEQLCTFNGDRLDKCYVFFAVKNNVTDIKREDFTNPKREDEYGTSVISIQFDKGDINTLSIKNRYNHKVKNPDATFSNNLENIIPGLTASFTHKYNLNIQSNEGTFEMDDYVFANGKYYKYNYMFRNIYYCSRNLIIKDDEVVRDYLGESKNIISDYQNESEKYIVADYFLIDLSNKEIRLYDDRLKDGFPTANKGIRKISVEKYENGSRRIIASIKEEADVEIIIDKNNRIIGYKNDALTNLPDGFMFGSKYLTNIDISNVEEIKDDVLYMNDSMPEIRLPKVRVIGYGFLHSDTALSKIDGPNVERVDDNCFSKTIGVEVNLPNLKYNGDNFLSKKEEKVK